MASRCGAGQPDSGEDTMKRRLLSRCLVIMLFTAVGTLATSVPTPFALAKKKTAAKKAPAQTDAGQASEGGETDKVRVERGTGGRKVYKIEGAIVIEGKIQKPEAFYVLQKSGINYDWHELKQEFVPKILDSVTKAPF
jgi:hypothetical protein